MGLERLPDWESRLSVFLSDRACTAFRWGSNDCALFGADAVSAITGEDHGEPFRGKYEDAKGAALALRQYGAGTIVKTFDVVLPRVPIALAQRGDLASVGKGIAGAVGVVIGGEAVFVDDNGLNRVDRAHWLRCWKVG